MQATLIRFGPDLLAVIRAEARLGGVSVAQYVREAALARVAYTAGRRGDVDYDAALAEVTGGPLARRQRMVDETRRMRREQRALAAEDAGQKLGEAG